MLFYHYRVEEFLKISLKLCGFKNAFGDLNLNCKFPKYSSFGKLLVKKRKLVDFAEFLAIIICKDAFLY